MPLLALNCNSMNVPSSLGMGQQWQRENNTKHPSLTWTTWWGWWWRLSADLRGDNEHYMSTKQLLKWRHFSHHSVQWEFCSARRREGECTSHKDHRHVTTIIIYYVVHKSDAQFVGCQGPKRRSTLFAQPAVDGGRVGRSARKVTQIAIIKLTSCLPDTHVLQIRSGVEFSHQFALNHHHLHHHVLHLIIENGRVLSAV